MKVIGLNNKIYNLSLPKIVLKDDQTKRSKPHLRAKEILGGLFRGELIYEEVGLPGSGRLKVDFYVPRHSLMVEVQGRQHSEYVGHFHKNKLAFLKQLKRDQNKRKWCELNQIVLVELYDGDWEEQLRGAISGVRRED